MTSMRSFIIGAVIAVASFTGAAAADLRIGLPTPPTAIDPHFHNLGPNHAVASHVFDALALKDEKQQLKPGLATSWRTLDDTTWEFTLRRGVTFHDGSPFTAEDVAFTMERAPNVPKSPNPMSTYTKGIASLEVVDSHTIRIKTKGPYPLLANELSNIWIISKKHGASATTDDYTRGKAVIGTGPYRFVSWQPGDHIQLERNPAYWGGQEPWEAVTLRFMKNGPSRVAALLAGDIDVIGSVPTNDIANLQKKAGVSVWGGPSNRLVFLAFDPTQDALSTGLIRDKAGNIPAKNPLGDRRVREALTRAIDRDVIVSRVYQGLGLATAQIAPPGFVGYIDGYTAPKYDPAAARLLLAEAGWPDGFKVTLVTSNDRIANAVKTVQAVAQMWARVGVETAVETMPHSVFTPRRNKHQLPVFMSSWGNLTGEASFFLGPLLHTKDKAKGLGAANRTRYSNPELDALIEKAQNLMSVDQRDTVLQQASRIAIEDYALPPLVLQMAHWATRKGLRYTPRVDQYTMATHVRPK